MKDLLIIGGGICGLSTAYYLSKQGFNITIIDKGNLEDNCSFGNAGYITPSHFIPLAAPGVILQGLKWMMNPSSPLFIKPRLDRKLLQWMWLFYRASNQKTVDRVAPSLLDFQLMSKQKYEDLSKEEGFDFHFNKNGLLMLCQTEKKLKEELEVAAKANELGQTTQVLSSEEIQALEPEVQVDTIGGILYKDDANLMPNMLMKQLITYLKAQSNVEFLLNKTVAAFNIKGKKIKSVILSDNTEIAGSQILVSAGAYSGKLLKSAGVSCPMQGGKGYSLSCYDLPVKPQYPAILVEHKIALSSSGPLFRIGGTMEINNFNTKMRKERVEAILKGFRNFYPDMKLPEVSTKDFWFGFRPCSPDGLPYIGRIPNLENAFVSAGHGMLGISMGMGTGWVNSLLIQGKDPGRDLSHFDPGRFN